MNSTAHTPKNPTIRRKTSRWKRFLWWALSVLVLLVAIAGFLFYTTQQFPEFYRRTLSMPSRELAESGAEFEQRMLDVHNASQRIGPWQVEFTTDQLNGWLAVEVPKKHSSRLPSAFENPRFSFREERIHLVFQVKASYFRFVVNVLVSPFCTDQENEIGMMVHSVHTGVIPIPIRSIADRISSGLRRADIPSTWTESEGKPVLMMTLPRNITDVNESQTVLIESLIVGEGHMTIAGQTIARQ